MLNCGCMKTRLTRPRLAAKKKSGRISAAGMRLKILRTIAKIPQGKVSTYGAVAAAAGFPGRARQVARALHGSYGVPWQRVLGAGGALKTQGEHAFEQRFRLQSEGVGFRGKRVDMRLYEHRWKILKTSRAGAPALDEL